MPVSQVKPEALAALPTSTTGGPGPSAFGQAYQAASEAAWGTVEEQKQKAAQTFKVRLGNRFVLSKGEGRLQQLPLVGLGMQPSTQSSVGCARACQLAKAAALVPSLAGRQAGGGAAPAATADQGGQ